MWLWPENVYNTRSFLDTDAQSNLMFKHIGYFLLSGLVALIGILLLYSGFGSIQELRQLERIPASKARDVLPGEVNITAQARELAGATIPSFHTHTPSLYYRYTHEVEETDSDGNKHWKTVDTREQSIDFLLQDETGTVIVDAAQALHDIGWSVRESFQHTIGEHRYTEWRIESGQTLFVFAKAIEAKQAIHLSFTQAGYYSPIISNYDQMNEQQSMGTAGVLLLWAGLAMLGLAIILLMFAFNIHRLLVYLSALAMTLMLALVNLSHTMMQQDIGNGLKRYAQQLAVAENQIQLTLTRAGLNWQGWAEAGDFMGPRYAELIPRDRARFQAYRINLGLGQIRLRQQMLADPERWLLKTWGFAVPQALAGIPAQDQTIITTRLGEMPPTQLAAGWILVVGLGGSAALALTFLGYRRIKTKRLIENLPTSLSTGVSCGLTEISGRVGKYKKLLTTPHKQQSCVWYFYHAEEKRGSGKNAKWVTLTKDTRSVHFDCQDREGRILINPDGAEVITSTRSVEIQGHYRHTEHILAPDDALYAIGMASINPHAPDSLIIEKPAASEPFILSNYSEAEIMLKKARCGMWYFNFAFTCLVLALLLWFGIDGGFSATGFLFAGLSAPLYMILIMLLLHYNDLIYLRQRVQRNWANIDVSLKKRHDLMNMLETIIQRYFHHEQSLQAELALLRNSFSTADAAHVARYLAQENNAHRRMIALLERYPDLQAHQLIKTFMHTQATLTTEVALYRQGYNDAVELYNTRIHSLPDMFFARLVGFSAQPYVHELEPTRLGTA